MSEALDRIDLRVLDVLQSEGRITNKELAEKVNLSPSATHHRLQRLIAEGWLESFSANVNIDKLCSPVQCIATVSMNNHSPDSFNLLEKKVLELDEVLEAYTVSGSCDFIMRIACVSMQRYMALTDIIISSCQEISNISTHVILKNNKKFKRYPIKDLIISPVLK